MATNPPLSAPRKNSSDWTPWADDPILQEVYAIRDAISAECDDDMSKIFEALKRTQAIASSRKPTDMDEGDPMGDQAALAFHSPLATFRPMWNGLEVDFTAGRRKVNDWAV